MQVSLQIIWYRVNKKIATVKDVLAYAACIPVQ